MAVGEEIIRLIVLLLTDLLPAVIFYALLALVGVAVVLLAFGRKKGGELEASSAAGGVFKVFNANMIFKDIITSVIRRFLGDYIENSKEFNVDLGWFGEWFGFSSGFGFEFKSVAGDVALENLVLKTSALDELDLPIKVKHGYIGLLVVDLRSSS